MITDVSGKLLSQREMPMLATLTAESSPGGLRLACEGRGSIEVAEPTSSADAVAALLWGESVEVWRASALADRWLCDLLGCEVQLVYLPEAVVRAYQMDAQTSLADVAPLHLISEESVRALQAELAQPLDANRFRPNIVIAGGSAYEEDGWTRLQIGSGTYRVTEPCARCTLINIDQRSGQRGTEPLKALGRLRKIEGKLHFGIYLTLDTPDHASTFSLGDTVTVL
jgi:uncharacterized protein YcbX